MFLQGWLSLRIITLGVTATSSDPVSGGGSFISCSRLALKKPDCDRLLRRPHAVLSLFDVLYLFANEFPGLRGWRFSFMGIFLRTFQSFLFWHSNLPDSTMTILRLQLALQFTPELARRQSAWQTKCSALGMADDLLGRVDRIASGALPDVIHTIACGEDYFSFEMRDAAGTVFALPHIWIDSESSDRQIRDKLQRALNEALHPETLPDDLSVPDLGREEPGKL